MSDTFTKTLTISRHIDDVFAAWLDIEQFPEWMENVVSVTKTDDTHSHWKVRGPMGIDVEWDAETTMLKPGTRIGWKAQGTDVKVSGQVIFTALDDLKTQLTVSMHVAPQTTVGAVSEPFTNVEGKVETDLRNFKNRLEGRTQPGAVVT